MNNRIIFSSKSDEWATPQGVFDSLDAEFHFNLDPCATEDNAKCDLFYTKEQNGLEKSWGGTECSVIPHIARLANGSRNAIEKVQKTTLSWSC